MTAPELAKKYNVSLNTLKSKLKSLGIQADGRIKNKRGAGSPTFSEEAISRIDEGLKTAPFCKWRDRR